MNKDEKKSIRSLTVSELKALIKECIREFEDEKQFTEENYKAMWKKQPILPKVLNARPIETETMPPQCSKSNWR